MQAATSSVERHLEKLERTRISLNNRVYLILQTLYKKNYHLLTQLLL